MKLTPLKIEETNGSVKQTLEGVQKAFGFVPNLLGTMAHAGPVLDAYLALSEKFGKTTLTPTEQQVVSLAASAENGCRYCMAAHTVIARMQKVDESVIGALREGTPIADAKLETLRRFTIAVVNTRGRVSCEEKKAFAAAGYTSAQALEVLLGVTMKTLSNYTNAYVGTELDPQFQGAAWEKSCTAGACGCSH